MKINLKVIVPFVVLFAIGLAGCSDASYQENNQTWRNRQSIASAIPLPPLSYSARRLVLAKYYLVLERPRLETCTYISGRGANGEAVIPTFGPSVNLSNQMTPPNQSEPDSVYVGSNDQTLVVLRNGNFATIESDVVTVGGNCPEGVRPNTPLQRVLEQASGGKPAFDFTNEDGLRVK